MQTSPIYPESTCTQKQTCEMRFTSIAESSAGEKGRWHKLLGLRSVTPRVWGQHVLKGSRDTLKGLSKTSRASGLSWSAWGLSCFLDLKSCPRGALDHGLGRHKSVRSLGGYFCPSHLVNMAPLLHLQGTFVLFWSSHSPCTRVDHMGRKGMYMQHFYIQSIIFAIYDPFIVI